MTTYNEMEIGQNEIENQEDSFDSDEEDEEETDYNFKDHIKFFT